MVESSNRGVVVESSNSLMVVWLNRRIIQDSFGGMVESSNRLIDEC